MVASDEPPLEARTLSGVLDDLQARVTRTHVRDPAKARRLLAQCIEELLQPLERPLVIGERTPTVIMVVGVNGAGKTTSVGKLARHLIDSDQKVLLVIDGNTGQNALAQVQAFDEALQLTGLVITKLDGTAKGGVLAAIALWSRSRKEPLPVYFVGVGEKLADLQTFRAREFAAALIG